MPKIWNIPLQMAAKPLSPAQRGSHPGASNCWVATREWKVVFVHDIKSYASRELSYAGSEEGKSLRLRIILMCILSNPFAFFSFKGKLQLWVGCCCDMSRQWLVHTSWPDSRRIVAPQPVISTFWFHLFSHSSSLFWAESSYSNAVASSSQSGINISDNCTVQ